MTDLPAALAALLYLDGAASTGLLYLAFMAGPPAPWPIIGHALAWPVMLPRLIIAWARENW